jgi:hypothetical protein
MRWFVWSAVTVLLLWGAYTASPYWALWDFRNALVARDEASLAQRVNFRAVRLSLAKQAVGEVIAARSGTDQPAGPESQMLANTVAVAADPTLEGIVTPQGVRRLLEELNPDIVGRPAADQQPRSRPGLPRTVWDTVTSARWRGFRNVYFALPPTAPDSARVRVQMRLSRLTWRVVSLELPPAARERLVEALRQSRRR